MRFSQRIGKRKISSVLEKETISQELRNSLWSLILENVLNNELVDYDFDNNYSKVTALYRSIWMHFFKRPIDNLPMEFNNYEVDERVAKRIIREWFFETEWDLVLDFTEFCSVYVNHEFQELCNSYFKSEFSAYRFVDGKLAEINSEEEIVEIEKAINQTDKFKPVKTHLETALSLLANKKSPDFRNSIKESISAVEAFSKIITKNNKTTLGIALKEIEKKHKIPESLKSAFNSLYGYTSDQAGIRHALAEKDSIVDIEDARFMLVTCSAFINYLMCKI